MDREPSGFRGKVFCFLPLPLNSYLPVHVNGNFILDASRRDLWHPTIRDKPDDWTRWNQELMEAIASSYADFLVKCQSSYVLPSIYQSRSKMWDDIQHYYKVFPRWLGHGFMSPERELLQVGLEFVGAVTDGNAGQYRSWLEELRDEDPPLVAFHWEIEFPEVFERENPGFDALVGNPPFAGKNSVSAANKAAYPAWLKELHEGSHGIADLVAHFFRRSFSVVRQGGALGLIATNTIAQGETRTTGLQWICKHGGVIYRARTRLNWPGLAAVVVSIVHISKGHTITQTCSLNGTSANIISAFLFNRGGHDSPATLRSNQGLSYQGHIIHGLGFTFDDTKSDGQANRLSTMARITRSDPRNSEVIRPFLSGEEVNSSPTHAHHRYVVNFKDYPLRREDMGMSWKDADEHQRGAWRSHGVVPIDYPFPVANDWPQALEVIEAAVRPQREALPPKNAVNRDASRRWWRFLAYRQGLQKATGGLDRVLAISRIGNAFAFTFLPTTTVPSDKIIVFPFPQSSPFSVLQSRAHEVWARFLCTTLKDDLQYTPSKCFATFPFPVDYESNSILETAGAAYYNYRATLMVNANEGLTKTYNRFHDPNESSPAIAKLRDLHAAMDRAVLNAYGWQDIPTDCQFLLDYEIDESEWGTKKKPYRYRWPNEVRDEVLARLLELNAQRAAQEGQG